MVSKLKIVLILGALLFSASLASADCTGQFPSASICGNATASQASPTGNSISTMLDAAFGAPAAQGNILVRGASFWAATSNPVIGLPSTTTGTLGLASSSGGTATITPPATGSNTALQLPTVSGTIPTTASSPLVLNATTGALTCPTCLTSSSGLTVNSTPVSGATAGKVLYSDGTKLQAYGITGTAGSVVLSSGPTIANITITGSFIAPGLVTNAALVSPTIMVNGTSCTLGSSCSPSATATSITVGAGGTSVLNGTGGYILFNNSGTLDNLPTTGSAGNVVLSGGPTLTGSATIASANFTGTLSISGTPEVFPGTGLIVGTTDTQALTNKTINGSLNTVTNINANTGLTGTVLNSGVVTSSLTTVGTIGTGVWNGTVVGVTYGGTGFSNPTSGAILKGQGASAMIASALADNGTTVSSTNPFELVTTALLINVSNAASTGTTNAKLAKLTGAPSTAVIATTSDTGGIVGVVVSGGGTTGSALIAVSGQTGCVFDGATTAGDYVQASSSVNGDCSDIGPTYPGSGQAIGRVLSTHGGAGTYTIEVFPPEINGGTGGGGGVSSVHIVAGSFIGLSGSCNSSSSINCTVSAAFLGGSLSSTAGAM